MSAPRAFRLLGQAQLAFAQERAQLLATAWAREWLREGQLDVQLRAAEALPPLRGPWLSLQHGDATCHLQRDAGVAERLLFGAQVMHEPSELAREAADEACVDFAQRCLGRGGTPALRSSAEAPAALWQRGSGALQLSLRLPQGTIELLLDGEAAAAWLAQRPRAASPKLPARLQAMSELRTATGHARLRLSAWSGQAQVSVATWQSLAPGDVLPLDLRFDQPLHLHIDGQPTTQRAFLGVRDGHRALRLSTAADPSSIPSESP